MKKAIGIILAAIMTLSITASALASDTADSVVENEPTVYKAGEYFNSTALPSGEYIIMAEEGKTGSYSFRNKMDQCIYKESFEYCTIIYINDNNVRLVIENAYAVPSGDIKSLDLTRNGFFRVGIDIPAGTYYFKRKDNASFGYVGRFSDISKNYYNRFSYSNVNKGGGCIFVDNYDSDEVNLNNNTYVAVINCDIYKDGKLYAQDTDKKSEYSFENITPLLKDKIDKDLAAFEKSLHIKKYNADSHKKYYINSRYKEWTGYIQNDTDKKYVDMVYDTLCCISDYYKVIGDLIMNNMLAKEEKLIASELDTDFKRFMYAGSFDELESSSRVITSYLTELAVKMSNVGLAYTIKY